MQTNRGSHCLPFVMSRSKGLIWIRDWTRSLVEVFLHSIFTHRSTTKLQNCDQWKSQTPKNTNAQMELNVSKENIGFQNSNFNLKRVEAALARHDRIHLIFEHFIKIKQNLNLENGKYAFIWCNSYKFIIITNGYTALIVAFQNGSL